VIIDKRDYKINILILFMEHEADVTIATVETFMDGIEEGVIVSILLNGGSRTDLRDMFSALPHIRYYESPTNLGVAGGRNFLLGTEESKSSDIIMFMDNDVIPTTDYVRNLATFLVDHPDAGIVGASVLNVGPFFSDHGDSFGRKTGIFGNVIRTITNRRIRRILVRRFENRKFNHIGIDEDWYNAYFSSLDLKDYAKELLGIKRGKSFYSHAKFNKKYTFSYLTNCVKEIPVSNVIGATQAFRRQLLEDIGPLDNIFNPYGYEDADFSIRAVKRGYRNYTDTHTFLLHGTDTRHSTRQDVKLHAKLSNEFRCLTLLYRLHFPDRFEELIRRRIFYEYMMRYVKGEKNADETLYYCLKGHNNGLKQIEEISSL
jgi:GT2 family glycosyltransferase